MLILVKFYDQLIIDINTIRK